MEDLCASTWLGVDIFVVARVVHFIRTHIVGKTLAIVKAPDDANVFGKVGTTGQAFEKALTSKTIVDAGQQGKYFWYASNCTAMLVPLTSYRLVMSSPPHPLFHFGMTGWFHIRGVSTAYYRDGKPESEDWPPRFWKFSFTTKKEPSKPITEAAFVDSRRFARIRLIDCSGEDIRNVSPLKENGPDPVIDSEVVTEEWLAEKCKAKRVPIKALLLDQANISGIGNWVG